MQLDSGYIIIPWLQVAVEKFTGCFDYNNNLLYSVLKSLQGVYMHGGFFHQTLHGIQSLY